MRVSQYFTNLSGFMKRILITGVGGPTPRSIARTLKQPTEGSYSLIGADCNKYAVGLYQTHVFDKTYLVPPAGKEGYWEAIRAIVERHDIEYAIIQPELEVLEWARVQQTENLPCKVLLPDIVLAEVLTDKAKTSEILAPHGLVPPTISFEGDALQIEEVEAELSYPFWIRSSSGSSGVGSLKVQSRAELQNWIRINKEVEHFIASGYLPGRNLACKLLYHEGDLLRSACAERVNYIMAKVAPSGITGNTSFGRLLNDERIVDVARRAMNALFRKTGTIAHGFFTVDLKEDGSGTPYVTEVNVRHVAFTGCLAAAGASLAEDTLRLLQNDGSFDRIYRQYRFPEGMIFLRDVDEVPRVMKESELLERVV